MKEILAPGGALCDITVFMSKKSDKIAALIMGCHGQGVDAHYLGYFECFNRELFYEAHDVLEELWLAHRHSANYSFYKGLIQLAGAFVHLQKNRLRPAAALFKLARTNLHKYPATHDHLDVRHVLGIIEQWLGRLEASHFAVNPLGPANAPQLHLLLAGAGAPPRINPIFGDAIFGEAPRSLPRVIE